LIKNLFIRIEKLWINITVVFNKKILKFLINYIIKKIKFNLVKINTECKKNLKSYFNVHFNQIFKNKCN
jgi:hypothetical protein